MPPSPPPLATLVTGATPTEAQPTRSSDVVKAAAAEGSDRELAESKPAGTKPLTSQPETSSEPATAEVATSKPTRSEPTTSDPTTSEAAASEETNAPSVSELGKLTEPIQLAYSEMVQLAPQAQPVEAAPQSVSAWVDRAFKTLPPLGSIEPATALEGMFPTATAYPEREKIYFRPTVVDVDRNGQPKLRPNVRLAQRYVRTVQTNDAGNAEIGDSSVEQLPPGPPEPVIPDQWAAPIVDGPYEEYGVSENCCPPRLGPCQQLWGRVCARLNGPCGCEPGLGPERVMHAVAFVDTTQPQKNFRTRFDAGYDWELPDRSEYFWARINGRGPSGRGPERNVDFQDIRFYMELGGPKFSVATEVPIRIVDPDVYENGSGLGDVNITTKLLFIDGQVWQISNLFRTYVPSGNPSAGVGVGHASIEPGFAWRYKWSDVTYIHGDLKYWVPLGGDQLHAGEALIYGFAMSHVWIDADDYAIMPTLELVGYTFLDGEATVAGIGNNTVTAEVDSDGILNFHPGIRWVVDDGGDCGIKEFGVFGGVALTSDHLYRGLLRLEVRYVW